MEWIFRKYEIWNFERISRHVAYWFAWACFYVILNTLIHFGHSFSQWALFELIVVPIKISCTLIVAYWFMPKYLYTAQYFKFFSFSFLNFVFFGLILFFIYNYLVYPYILKIDVNQTYIAKFAYKGIELVHIASLFICYKFFQHILSQEQKNKELLHFANDARLKYLKHQIQPHFLFNTLNNLYGMVLSKNEKSAETIIKLSDMMSYMLYETSEQFVPLQKEIQNLQNFVALEVLRYDRKLELVKEIDQVKGSEVIAPMLLLPLVENAFKHGPGSANEMSFIKIVLKLDGQNVFFEVSNTFNSPTMNKVHSGIGLENVKQRLGLLYPGKHSLKVSQDDQFKVSLTISLDHDR